MVTTFSSGILVRSVSRAAGTQTEPKEGICFDKLTSKINCHVAAEPVEADGDVSPRQPGVPHQEGLGGQGQGGHRQLLL